MTSLTGDRLNSAVPEDRLGDSMAAVLLAVTALLGITVNTVASILLFRVQILSNTFGYLNVNRMVASSCALLVYLLWIAPTTYFKADDLGISMFGRKVVQLSTLFWYVALWTNVTLSINRLTAIAFPGSYRAIFHEKNLKFILPFLWIIGFVSVLEYFLPNCDLYYKPSNYILFFTESECSTFASFWLDFLYSMTLSHLCLLLDIISLVLLLKVSRSCTTNTNLKRNKRNWRFFLQIMFDELILSINLISCHFISGFAKTKWDFMFTVTLNYELCFCSTGFLLFLFVGELRKKLIKTILRQESTLIHGSDVVLY